MAPRNRRSYGVDPRCKRTSTSTRRCNESEEQEVHVVYSLHTQQIYLPMVAADLSCRRCRTTRAIPPTESSGCHRRHQARGGRGALPGLQNKLKRRWWRLPPLPSSSLGGQVLLARKSASRRAKSRAVNDGVQRVGGRGRESWRKQAIEAGKRVFLLLL